MIGLTVLPSITMGRCQGEQLRDIVQYFGSDVVFTPDRVHEPFLTSQIGDAATVVTQPLVGSSPRELARQPDVRLIWISSPADLDLERIVQNKRTGPADGCTHLYLLSDCLSLSIDLVNLDASLDGLEAYRAPLDEHEMTDAFTHLTIEANPEYRADWEGLDVQGVMPGVSEQQGISQAGVAHFDLQANGIVGAKTRPLKRFGLTATDQVGRARATTLRQAGIQSRADLATASIHEISTLDGFGQTTARTAIESAQVIEQGELRKAPGTKIPETPPVFIDIETDGLNPTMIWLIGVLAPGEDSQYMSFLETDPSRPAVALEAFLTWLVANGNGRPVVAYNGWNFDFPVITEHITDHCPRYLDFWESTYRFDLYDWATNKNNAILPGLTNKLEDVAQALGWEPLDTGLTGGEVGRLFQRYAENPCPATELDWNRHETYCEDDVRSLAYVYNRIRDSTNRMTTNSGNGVSPSADTTSQGTLLDF
jgi:uncharacterized protein YprB with RNaseH-like and TPR domain